MNDRLDCSLQRGQWRIDAAPIAAPITTILIFSAIEEHSNAS